MMGPTHIAGGALAGLAASALAGYGGEQAVAMTVGAVATSRLPDIDRKFNRGPKHRSITHSLVLGGAGAFLLMLAAMLWANTAAGARMLQQTGGWITPELVERAAFGGWLGYMAHLALDAPTREGIWLLLPGGKRLRPPERQAVKTDGFAELVTGLALVGGCVMLGISVFGADLMDLISAVALITGL